MATATFAIRDSHPIDNAHAGRTNQAADFMGRLLFFLIRGCHDNFGYYQANVPSRCAFYMAEWYPFVKNLKKRNYQRNYRILFNLIHVGVNVMAVTIRRATLDDCTGIANVHIDSWRSTYSNIVPEEYLSSMSYSDRENRWRTILNDGNENHIMYVAVNEEGKIVGFANGGPERSNDVMYDCELYAIYLLKEIQRQGNGKQLVKAVVEELSKKYHAMLVWVLAENQSRYFYEALGGKYVRESVITIAGKELVEIAYGWSDLKDLKTKLI
jgi:L-amino acid N-acyltransferase YncA